jgi:hypothetical protein
MNDHTPGRVSAIDFGPVTKSTAELIRAMNKAFSRVSEAIRPLGDYMHQNQHSYHIHLSEGTRYMRTPLERALWYAQDELYDAYALVDGPYRHRAVKAARDEIRRINKLIVRDRGWHR